MAKQHSNTKPTMTAALRQSISDSKMSYHELEQETGVKRQSLMKFAAGEQSLRLDLADRLADYFGLVVVKRKVR